MNLYDLIGNKKKKEDDTVVSLCEQGDLGLFGDPLSEADQKKYKKAQEEESKRNGNSCN